MGSPQPAPAQVISACCLTASLLGLQLLARLVQRQGGDPRAGWLRRPGAPGLGSRCLFSSPLRDLSWGHASPWGGVHSLGLRKAQALPVHWKPEVLVF